MLLFVVTSHYLPHFIIYYILSCCFQSPDTGTHGSSGPVKWRLLPRRTLECFIFMVPLSQTEVCAGGLSYRGRGKKDTRLRNGLQKRFIQEVGTREREPSARECEEITPGLPVECPESTHAKSDGFKPCDPGSDSPKPQISGRRSYLLAKW